MNFLIFFAIFIATILLAIVLERELRSPIIVAIAFFAIYLIIVTALFAFGIITDFPLAILIVTIYAIIAFITASIVRFIRCLCRRYIGNCCNTCPANGNEDIDEDLAKNLGTTLNNRQLSNYK